VNHLRQPGFSPLRSALLSSQNPASATPLFSAPSALFSRVRIHLIPLNLRFLCFHTLTHSFASSNVTTSFFSIAFALFSQKHPGGVLVPSNKGSRPRNVATFEPSNDSGVLPLEHLQLQSLQLLPHSFPSQRGRCASFKRRARSSALPFPGTRHSSLAALCIIPRLTFQSGDAR
jgi:hypothetical protein